MSAPMNSGSECIRRVRCRLCNSPHLTERLKLKPCPPVDAFVTEDKKEIPQKSFPLDLFMCETCGHFQLLDVVNPSLLFGDYIYTTSSSPGLVKHFEEYANNVIQTFPDMVKGLAVDIGSNDGTLLSFFKRAGCAVLGVDPAKQIAAEATSRGIETINLFFTDSAARDIVRAYGQASIVTANNVFAHSDNLGDMAAGVKQLLEPKGVFIFEVSYMLSMIDNMVFDFIYHEHLSHHSVRPLQLFLGSYGLELFDVESNQSKGGSLRCFAQHKGGPRRISSHVGAFIEKEKQRGLYEPGIFVELSEKIAAIRLKIDEALDAQKLLKKKIFGYGASATATVLLYHFDLGDTISAIIDDNPLRQGRYSPGHHLPVVSSQMLTDHPDSVTIILAWRFADMIVERNREYLNRGGCFIVPLPEFSVRQ